MNNCGFSKGKQKSNGTSLNGDSDGEYSNLILNQNHKCPILISVQSLSKTNKATFKLPDHTVSDYNEGKANLNAWNKSHDSCLNTSNFSNDINKKAEKKDNSSSNNSKSTLSLHITAFENPAAAFLRSNTIKCESKKEIFTASTFVTQNSFEFSRQQSDKMIEPEVSQFRASQQLLSPNEGSTNGQQNIPVLQQQQLAPDLIPQLQQQPQFPPQIYLFNTALIFAMLGRLNGIIFASLLFITSLLGSVFICFPFVPLAFFAPRIFRFVCDRFVGYWLTFPASMLTFMFGVKFHVSGDLIEHSKPSLIIMNHRTRLDWMFFWNALYKMNPWLLTSEKISLKSGLKSIPGAGWAMGCGGYIFLNRNYELDQRIMETMLQYYKESHGSYQLLLFPEGTDRGERAARISDEFAKKNGLQKYDYVLHPRTTGFNFILNEMRKHDYIDAIYDVTVAYPDKIVPSETDLITKGILPKNVHFDIKKYKLSDILTKEQEDKFHRDPIDASSWLLNLWKEKEARLKKFYSQAPERRKLEPSGKGYVWPVETKGIGYYLAFFFWIITSLMWIYFTYTIFWVKLYIVGAILFYLYAHKYHGGSEFLFLEWFFGRRFFFERAQ